MSLEQFLELLRSYLEDSMKAASRSILKIDNTYENFVALAATYQAYEEVFHQVAAILQKMRKGEDDNDD